jgi:AraC-like DNA-binding protein
MTDISEHCGVSRRLIEANFCRSVGRTPLRFLTDIRMERAVALLMERNRTVAEIAEMCGFASANYFTKAFRHHYGLSPLKYLEKGEVIRGTSAPAELRSGAQVPLLS